MVRRIISWIWAAGENRNLAEMCLLSLSSGGTSAPATEDAALWLCAVRVVAPVQKMRDRWDFDLRLYRRRLCPRSTGPDSQDGQHHVHTALSSPPKRSPLATIPGIQCFLVRLDNHSLCLNITTKRQQADSPREAGQVQPSLPRQQVAQETDPAPLWRRAELRRGASPEEKGLPRPSPSARHVGALVLE